MMNETKVTETIHETKDGMVLEAGVRLWYTGDMANSEREGTIDKLYRDKWGVHVAVTLDEIGEGEPERKTTLSPANFEPGPGRRFITLQRHTEEHEAAIAKMRADYEERGRR